ncbi:Bifunctional monodehydroascorbate reductase and carbonic anhydrase nectarin-3 [Morella rubra]|uniref:Carbonic anhydrase n=1 Tax=Morella rubra TaxID=262757 RepID=A0A6A1WFZ6_9ROSI|nr:Bifunctional monodehydroascorbate reductase and carbonic anhydrase nectarin-3 [Morella rubra]
MFGIFPPEHTVSFGYNGDTGPGNWGNLSPHYETCSNGKWQSPVDIVKEKVVRNKSLKPLIRDYSPANATLINHGFNIAITFDEHVGVLVADGKNFTLKNVHWHSPSEHRIEGEQFPLELHLVHKAADGNFSVVSTLYRYGDPDPFLYKLKDKLDELGKESCSADEEAHIPLGVLQTKYMRRNTRKYYRYFGSLTTPPCTEHIMWNILGKVRSISKDQVEALRAPLWSTCKNNSRPIQPLSGRHIELYDELGNN